MSRTLINLFRAEDGVLSFEWTVLVTLLTIGIVTGLAAARDGIVDELGDAAQAMVAVDGSFRIDFPLEIRLDGVAIGGASDSEFLDAAFYEDCNRTDLGGPTQGGLEDGPE